MHAPGPCWATAACWPALVNVVDNAIKYGDPGRQRADAVAQPGGGRRRLQRNQITGTMAPGRRRALKATLDGERFLRHCAPSFARPLAWDWPAMRRGNAAAWRQHAAGAGPACLRRGAAPATAHTLVSIEKK